MSGIGNSSPGFSATNLISSAAFDCELCLFTLHHIASFFASKSSGPCFGRLSCVGPARIGVIRREPLDSSRVQTTKGNPWKLRDRELSGPDNGEPS
jgi:hypothetical protein